MTPKKATPKPEAPATPDLWRLAEVMQMRRVDKYGVRGVPSAYYLQCALCLAKTADLTAEIEHKDYCPINRMKKGS